MTRHLKKESECLIRFGEYLNGLRFKRGLSMLQLGARLGVNVTYISLVERGLREPDDKFVVSTAKFFGQEENLLFDILERVPLKVLVEVDHNTLLHKAIKEIITSDCSVKRKEDIYLAFYRMCKKLLA